MAMKFFLVPVLAALASTAALADTWEYSQSVDPLSDVTSSAASIEVGAAGRKSGMNIQCVAGILGAAMYSGRTIHTTQDITVTYRIDSGKPVEGGWRYIPQGGGLAVIGMLGAMPLATQAIAADERIVIRLKDGLPVELPVHGLHEALSQVLNDCYLSRLILE